MHTSYEEKLGRPPDFRVEYSFYSIEQGGRKQLPFQGYRSDFYYEHSAHSSGNKIFMIWPEFEDEFGNLILDDTIPVRSAGKARMWIIIDKMRDYHANKIKQGLIGYFMEGSRRVAECKIIEIQGLGENL